MRKGPSKENIRSGAFVTFSWVVAGIRQEVYTIIEAK